MIWALNLASLLILLAGGIALILYAVFPTKPYAKSILGFGYKKPLYALVLFLIELVILYSSATLLTGVSFPMVGTTSLKLPSAFIPGGMSVSVNVSATFGLTFYFAIAVVVLCILARLYHRKVEGLPLISKKLTASAATPPPPPTTA